MSQPETDAAPDSKVILSDGTEKRLSDFWSFKPLALLFIRHFGCPFCREEVARLRREKETVDRAGFQVLLVSMGTPEEAEGFRRQFNLPFTIICDPEKALYKAYGLKGRSISQIFSPKLFLKGLKAVGQGFLPGLSLGDPFQLPGVVVIDVKGHIRFRYYSRDPSDYPSIAIIVDVLSRV